LYVIVICAIYALMKKCLKDTNLVFWELNYEM
jgi:hypothetical protein